MPSSTALIAFTACTNGRKPAIFSNAPPTSDKSNHMSESHAEIFVSTAPHNTPTILSLKAVPHNNPIEIYKKAGTMLTSAASRIFTENSSPNMSANRQVTRV